MLIRESHSVRLFYFFFFFSSRRRHTRFKCDWSSDVCSSDLHDHQYNVFVFDFVAHGANGGITSFGYHEADEVRAAIDGLARRNDVNPDHFGLWGYNLGAYAVLREAESDKRVRALILDSLYDSPEQMVKIGVEKEGLAGNALMRGCAESGYG